MSVERFLEAIRSFGLEPPSLIQTGEFVRFPGQGKGVGNVAGWCFLSTDELAGWFGDWSTGQSESWFYDRCEGDNSIRRSSRYEQRRRRALAPERERVARQIEAARRAREIWRRSEEVDPEHPYIIAKRIKPLGARGLSASLVLPVVDFQRSLTSLQFISATGGKRLLAGGRKQGSFIPVADRLGASERIVICEGWATACTLAEYEPMSTVLAAVDAGNLMSVALSARSRWPSCELVIAGDDDRATPGNPGANKANAAAVAARALLAMPQWDQCSPDHLSDFNDLENSRMELDR